MSVDRSRVLQQAQLLASRGQYEAAIAEWKKMAIDAPADGSIYNSIGDLQLKRNAQSEAAMAFLQAASAFRVEGAILKAIAAFKKVLKCDPSRYEVYRHLGDLNAERGLVSSAIQDYQTLGKYYLKERRGKEALEIYKKIVSYDPSNLSAQQRVAELCVQENLQDEATKVYLQLGRERSAQGRYDEAKDAYLAVLRIDPHNSEAAQFVDSIQKNSTGAAKASKPNSVTPVVKSSEPLDLLAEATRRIEEKQYAGAEAILNQMLTREPGNPQVCQLLARLHLQRGDVQIALGEYRFLAGAALRAHEFVLAESLIQEFLLIQPDSVPILELLGELYEEKGEASAAAAQYAKAIELLLEHPEPGLESLHEELFDKVRALSTDPVLIDRLADRIKGGRVEKSHGMSGDDAPSEASGNLVALATGAMESAEPAGAAEANSSLARHNGEFSVAGAQSDVMDGFAGEMLAHHPDGSFHEAHGSHDAQTLTTAQPSPAETASLQPDYDAYYTLGVAYKNMGLYEEAHAAFQVSIKNDVFYLDSALMTALCLKEQHHIAQAIRGIEAILGDPRCQGAKGQAIRYELGLLYEEKEQWDKATDTFQSIPSFHDVPQRLAALKGKHMGGNMGFRHAS